MITSEENETLCSPMRALEILTARFGAFEAIACLAIEFNRKEPDDCLPMDAPTADAILEFGDDLRQVRDAVRTWVSAHGLNPLDSSPQTIVINPPARPGRSSGPGGRALRG